MYRPNYFESCPCPCPMSPMSRTIFDRYPRDQYHLVGYMIGRDDRFGNAWKLFGRETPNHALAEFYVVPANTHYDVRVVLTRDMFVGNNRLRTLYDLPQSIFINHPMFSKNEYIISEVSNNNDHNLFY
jgi:hypothetical protein